MKLPVPKEILAQHVAVPVVATPSEQGKADPSRKEEHEFAPAGEREAANALDELPDVPTPYERAAFFAGWKAAKRDEDANDDEDIADAPDVAFLDWQKREREAAALTTGGMVRISIPTWARCDFYGQSVPPTGPYVLLSDLQASWKAESHAVAAPVLPPQPDVLAFVERCAEIRHGSPNAFYAHVDRFCKAVSSSGDPEGSR